MFNFIFEGKLGNILAPVLPTNQLYLAIQHHKNAEVQEQIGRIADYELRNCSESGYGAIHVACRYNNKFAVNLILDKGISVDIVDTNGNTPLHYASKYGNIDICRCLVERKCSPAKRNSQNETPYDVAENHVVRQYLLPLQLSSEREAQEAAGIDPMSQYGMPPMMGSEYPVYSMNVAQPQPTISAPEYPVYSVNVAQPQPTVSAPEYPVYSMNVAQPQPTVSAPEYPVYSLGAQSNVPPQTIPPTTIVAAPEYPVYSIGTQLSVSNPPTSNPVSNPPPAIHIPQQSQIVPPIAQNPIVNIPKSGSGNGSPIFASSNLTTALPKPNSNSSLVGANIGPSVVVPPAPSSSSHFQQVQPTYGGPIPSQQAPVDNMIPVTPSVHIPQVQQSSNFNNSNSKRAIQPDGFHSSASDPVLQARYGHVKASINIAPPPTSFPTPTAAAPQYGLYNNGINPTAPTNIYSRYVAYDVHTNSAIPPPAHNIMPMPGGYNQPQYQNMAPPPSAIIPNPIQMQQQQQFSNPPPYRSEELIAPVPMNVQPMHNRNIAVFNPTDDVISASSSSSSVL